MSNDSDSDTPLERVDSGPKVYDTVPVDKEYHIRLVAVKNQRFLYTLKAGQSLPYDVSLQGHNFTFDKTLKLTMKDVNWVKSPLENKSGTWWNIFKLVSKETQPGAGANVDSSAGSFGFSLGEAAATSSSAGFSLGGITSMTAGTSDPAVAASTLASPSSVTNVVSSSAAGQTVQETVTETTLPVWSVEEQQHVEMLSKLYEIIDDGKARCHLCGYLSNDPNVVMTHIMESHPNWQQSIPTPVIYRKLGNVNNYPEWKEDLKQKFVDLIVDKCSLDTRVAWAQNEKITNQAKFLEIRSEILRKLVDHIVQIYGTVSAPNYKTLEYVVKEILAPGYPFMFRADDNSASNIPNLGFGYRRGGLKGIENLHKNLWDQIYQKQLKLKKEMMLSTTDNDEDVGDNEAETGPGSGRRGRKPHKYGVDNIKYYASASDTERGEYEATGDIDDEGSREQVYSANRNAITEMIRTSGKVISRVIRGFFNSPVHLHLQFLFFSPGSDDLKDRIETNWAKQIDFMEKYIEKKNKQGRDQLLKLKDKIQLEYNGSVIIQQVMVVRLLADVLDGDGKSFLLLEDEDIVTSSPFIKVIELQDRSFLFEIWADRQKLLDGQNLMAALASYFELCFVFQLEYPKQSQTVINILQRKAARYGDDKGTLTNMRKDTAMNKLAKYLTVVGDIATGS